MGDTAATTNEMDLAVEIQPQDAGLRFQYGFVLGSMSHLRPAEEQLRKSIEMDPQFAAPHFVLGQVLEALGNRQGAIQEYESFLSLGSTNNPPTKQSTRRPGVAKCGGSAVK